MRSPGRAPKTVPEDPFAAQHVTVSSQRPFRPHGAPVRVSALQEHDRPGLRTLL